MPRLGAKRYPSIEPGPKDRKGKGNLKEVLLADVVPRVELKDQHVIDARPAPSVDVETEEEATKNSPAKKSAKRRTINAPLKAPTRKVVHSDCWAFSGGTLSRFIALERSPFSRTLVKRFSDSSISRRTSLQVKKRAPSTLAWRHWSPLLMPSTLSCFFMIFRKPVGDFLGGFSCGRRRLLGLLFGASPIEATDDHRRSWQRSSLNSHTSSAPPSATPRHLVHAKIGLDQGGRGEAGNVRQNAVQLALQVGKLSRRLGELLREEGVDLGELLLGKMEKVLVKLLHVLGNVVLGVGADGGGHRLQGRLRVHGMFRRRIGHRLEGAVQHLLHRLKRLISSNDKDA
ncbi:hypothetical protein TYRP_009560 [Tyrophagus putrescentiae]|nr:hypothetical protein TYRP_009560 [Tyrophagus putrescentiae]